MLYLRVLLRRMPLAVLLMVLLNGCALRQVNNPTHAALYSALWVKTSAEYEAAALQAYQLAASNLVLALADKQWTAAVEQQGDFQELPPAIILDLDQTVLDTTPYNARLIQEDRLHSTWDFGKWCQDSTAPATPGSKSFIDFVVERGVKVIYVSARSESLRACTIRNLQAIGLPMPPQADLLLSDGKPSTKKTQHRSRAAVDHRLLLLVGDDLGDFVDGSRSDPETRQVLAREYSDRWGR